MQRTSLAEGTTPEFLSATLLPGRGLNVLQIMLLMPGRGQIPLLQAPSLEEAAKLMSGMAADANGIESLRLGSPIEAPWAGFISGSRTDTPGANLVNWHSRPLFLPITGMIGDASLSQGGLLLNAETDTVRQSVMPDGGTLQGSFTASNFGERWPSLLSISVTALLSSRAFELKVIARNEGKEASPLGLGWSPQILFPGGMRNGVRLRVPAEQYEEMSGGRATGRLLAVAGTPLDFTSRRGKALQNLDLDSTFVDLRSGFLDTGPVLELRDEHNGVGLRMTAMSPQIHALHVHSLARDNKITIAFQTNYDDPFSRVWNKDEGEKIDVLLPGQSLQWRVRMEIFAISDANSGAL